MYHYLLERFIMNEELTFKDLFKTIDDLKCRVELLEKQPPTMNQLPDFMNAKDASEFLKVSKFTIYYYTNHKMIPYFKKGKRIYFKRTDLENFIMDEKYKYKVYVS